MTQISFYPQSSNVQKSDTYPYPVARIWSYLGIEIDRVVGTVYQPGFGRRSVTRTARYDNVTEASKKRLHKVVSRMVNKGRATVGLMEGGYEVEL